jgi:excisionase family DNA binding protein
MESKTATTAVPAEPDVLTVDEAAALLRVNRKTLYQAIAEGKVPGVIKIGRVIRISRSALASSMKTHGA